MKIASLHIYPLKGARAQSLKRASIEARGLEGDRRWVATDAEGVFLTQRECGALAQINASLEETGLRLSVDGGENFFVDTPGAGAPRRRIRVWKDDVDAVCASDGANDWLSAALRRPAKLFFMDDAAHRRTSGSWGKKSPVSFADAYPLLLTNEASLDALNRAIEESGGDGIGMERFRPNIVIAGDAAWSEDMWETLEIGGAAIRLVKPCVRCVVTTKDQHSGESMGKEPLKSLARLRRSAHPDLAGALFGWNAVVVAPGAVAGGDSVRVIQERREGFPLDAV